MCFFWFSSILFENTIFRGSTLCSSFGSAPQAFASGRGRVKSGNDHENFLESRAPMRRRRSFQKSFASEHHRLKSGNELLWRRRRFFFAIRCIGAPQAIIADNPCISAPQAEDRRSSPTGAAGEIFLKNLASIQTPHMGFLTIGI